VLESVIQEVQASVHDPNNQDYPDDPAALMLEDHLFYDLKHWIAIKFSAKTTEKLYASLVNIRKPASMKVQSWCSHLSIINSYLEWLPGDFQPYPEEKLKLYFFNSFSMEDEAAFTRANLDQHSADMSMSVMEDYFKPLHASEDKPKKDVPQANGNSQDNGKKNGKSKGTSIGNSNGNANGNGNHAAKDKDKLPRKQGKSCQKPKAANNGFKPEDFANCPNNGVCPKHLNVNQQKWGDCYDNPKNKGKKNGKKGSTSFASSAASAASRVDSDSDSSAPKNYGHHAHSQGSKAASKGSLKVGLFGLPPKRGFCRPTKETGMLWNFAADHQFQPNSLTTFNCCSVLQLSFMSIIKAAIRLCSIARVCFKITSLSAQTLLSVMPLSIRLVASLISAPALKRSLLGLNVAHATSTLTRRLLISSRSTRSRKLKSSKWMESSQKWRTPPTNEVHECTACYMAHEIPITSTKNTKIILTRTHCMMTLVSKQLITT
jgi:hypothetical protein